MTDETTMKAGRELDALVAEKVLGLTPAVLEERCRIKYRAWAKRNQGRGMLGTETWDADCPEWRREAFRSDEIPAYSTNIGAAWEVAERFLDIDVHRFYLGDDEVRGYHVVIMQDMIPFVAEADTAPLAICLAALATIPAQSSSESPSLLSGRGTPK